MPRSEPRASAAPVRATSASGGAATVTIAAVTDKYHFVRRVDFSYSATPTNGKLTITDGGTTIWEVDVTAAGPGFEDFSGAPLRGSKGAAVVVTLAAGGGAVVAKVNVQKDTRKEG